VFESTPVKFNEFNIKTMKTYSDPCKGSLDASIV
jgi:hypothetical protein